VLYPTGSLVLINSAFVTHTGKAGGNQQLIKWQGMEDDNKGRKLVQEWHEHVDM
jgi:hypothetical protein